MEMELKIADIFAVVEHVVMAVVGLIYLGDETRDNQYMFIKLTRLETPVTTIK